MIIEFMISRKREDKMVNWYDILKYKFKDEEIRARLRFGLGITQDYIIDESHIKNIVPNNNCETRKLKLVLNKEKDIDLIIWYESLPEGSKAMMIRQALRDSFEMLEEGDRNQAV